MGKFKIDPNGRVIDTTKQKTAVPTAVVVCNAAEVMEFSEAGGVIPTATVETMNKYVEKEFTDKFHSPGMDFDDMLDKLGDLFAKYEVPIGLLQKLCKLSEYDINVIIDDSGSMGQETDVLKQNASSDFMKLRLSNKPGHMTRFEEEEDRLHLLIDFLAYIPTGKIKVWCMNRGDAFELMHDGKSADEFKAIGHAEAAKLFTAKPGGGTPTMKTMQDSLRSAKRPTMHYLFTDGVPSDCRVADLAMMIKSRLSPERNPITLISCTNVDEECEWMKEIEEIAMYVSEVDDYSDELDEVRRDQGAFFPYTKGVWILCMLVAAIDPYLLDCLDDSRPFTKFSICELLGRTISDAEYFDYWASYSKTNPRYREFNYDKFRTAQTYTEKLVGKDTALNSITRKLKGIFT